MGYRKFVSQSMILLSVILFAVSAGEAARPGAPTNLTATVLSPTEIELTWTDNSTDETRFRIERCTDGVSFARVGAAGADITSFTDATVSGDTLYYYRVIAVGPGRDSNPSNTVSEYTADTVTPAAPQLVSPPNGDQLDTRNVKFEWQRVADMSGTTYHIIVTDLGNGVVLHDIDGISGTSIQVLLYDSVYSWTCSATDGAGNIGSDSETWYFTVAGEDTAPPDLSITGPNGGETLAGGSYYPITWYALDDLTSTPDLKIVLWYSLDGGANWILITRLSYNPGAFFWHVPNVNSDTVLVRVKAVDEYGKKGIDTSDGPFTITAGP